MSQNGKAQEHRMISKQPYPHTVHWIKDLTCLRIYLGKDNYCKLQGKNAPHNSDIIAG